MWTAYAVKITLNYLPKKEITISPKKKLENNFELSKEGNHHHHTAAVSFPFAERLETAVIRDHLIEETRTMEFKYSIHHYQHIVYTENKYTAQSPSGDSTQDVIIFARNLAEKAPFASYLLHPCSRK